MFGKNMSYFRLFLILCFNLFFMAASCGGPCRELAEKICDCKKDLQEREICKSKLGKRDDISEKIANKQLCEAVLEDKACTCDAINKSAVHKCGFTKVTPKK